MLATRVSETCFFSVDATACRFHVVDVPLVLRFSSACKGKTNFQLRQQLTSGAVPLASLPGFLHLFPSLLVLRLLGWEKHTADRCIVGFFFLICED